MLISGENWWRSCQHCWVSKYHISFDNFLHSFHFFFFLDFSNLAEIDPRIPPLFFGSLALISSFLTLFLPETAGKPLPNTVEECKLYESKTRGMKGTAMVMQQQQQEKPPPPYEEIS